MDFIDEVKRFSKHCGTLLDKLTTEEATKHSLILPFIQLLGYNIFDPTEVVPEFTADVGTKKGEKVDYAIIVNGKPAILIEAKAYGDDLSTHGSQLFRYFAVTEAKFAILTNGIAYKFFSDLQEPNKMDMQPFLEVDLLKIDESTVGELKRFHKENFNVDDLFSAAANLKYTNRVKQLLEAQLKEPSDDFLRFWLKDVYSGRLTQATLTQFRPIVKRALTQYFNDLISERLKTAMQGVEQDRTPEMTNPEQPKPAAAEATEGEDEDGKIVTTPEELEAFYIVKAILRQDIDPSRISHKDTQSYFGILLDNNIRRWVCRFKLDGPKKYLILHEEPPRRVDIESVDDIYDVAKDLLNIARNLTASMESDTE
ncbi:MAG: type I restriction endonuclease [Bacillota bacterium]